MLNDFMMFITIYWGTIILSCKVLNFQPYKSKSQIYFVLFSIILSFLTNLLGVYYVKLHTLPLLLLWMTLTILFPHPQATFVSTILAFCISYSIHALSSLVIILCSYPFYSDVKNISLSILALFTTFLHVIVTNSLLQIKRFKNGIPCLFLKPALNIATLICLVFIVLISYTATKASNKNLQLSVLFAFLFALPILIHWWQAQITKSYRHSVRERELESLRLEVQEKDKQLKELSKKNEQMGHLIHEDTKIIRTFISGLEDYVKTDFSDEGTRKDKGKELLEVVYEHADERLGTIRNISHKGYTTYSTNVEALNLQLNHFSKRASIEDITFHVHIACNLEDYIPKSISTTDLSHLLSNLLDNAFIAASYTETPTIQLQLYEVSNCLVIEIADSGIPFEVESLVNFGLIQRTTHENEGGSGIGLIEIWNLKEKYHATLHIEEYEQPCPYSKKLSLNFNHKNHFSIRTFRKKEIQYVSKRIDLQIYE